MAEPNKITKRPTPGGSNPKVSENSVSDQLNKVIQSQPKWASHKGAPGNKKGK